MLKTTPWREQKTAGFVHFAAQMDSVQDENKNSE